MTQHGTGPGPGVGPIPVEYLPVDESGMDTPGLGDQSLAATRQVMDVLRRHVVHRIRVEEDQVGHPAGSDHAPIGVDLNPAILGERALATGTYR